MRSIQKLSDDSPYDTDESFTAFLEAILPLFCSDPDRYLQRFEKTLEGTHLSAYAERALVAADKRYPRKQSQEYTEISAKTLILSGTLDWACPTEVSERMHTGIPGSILSLYANAGHLLWIEQPKRLFAEQSHFLGDIR